MMRLSRWIGSEKGIDLEGNQKVSRGGAFKARSCEIAGDLALAKLLTGPLKEKNVETEILAIYSSTVWLGGVPNESGNTRSRAIDRNFPRKGKRGEDSTPHPFQRNTPLINDCLSQKLHPQRRSN